MQDILNWMESSALSQMIVDSAWAFPFLETLHFIGLILLIGSLYIIDLRFIGFAPRIPLVAVMRFIPISLLGFLVILVTGILFLFTDPGHYYSSLAFRLKMLTVLLAGLNAIWFKRALNMELLTTTHTHQPQEIIRLIAGISLVLWTSVIILGRMIPYL